MKSSLRSRLRLNLALVLLVALVALLTGRHTAYAGDTTVPCDVNALTAAVNGSNSSPEADIIRLAQDCTYELEYNNGLNGGNGLPSITGPLTIVGNGATFTRSDLTSDNYRHLHVAESGALTVEDLTLTRGIPVGEGGSIYSAGALTLTRSTVMSNTAIGVGEHPSPKGGGIFALTGTVTILSSTVSMNGFEAGNPQAGGSGLYSSEAAVTIRDSLFEGNRAQGLFTNYQDTETVITNSIFRGNQDGGMRVGSYLTLHDSLIENNTGNSGAVVAEGSILDMVNTTIRNNGDGAGGQFSGIVVIDVLSYPVKRYSIRNSTISGNLAREAPLGDTGTSTGGGITWWPLFDDSVLTIENTTISENRGTRGGGINAFNYQGGQGNGLQLNNVTVTGNFASRAGGGIYAKDGIEVNVFNSIVAGNSTTGDGPDCRVDEGVNRPQEPINSLGYNLTTSTGACNFAATGDQALAGEVISTTVLFPLADNGGPTHTHLLRPNSPAIDSGSPALRGEGTACAASDQRGFNRPKDGDGDGAARCDIGAVEVNAAPTDITLFPTKVDEKEPVGTTVGSFSTVDPDTNDNHTYIFVAGEGSTDNGAFSLAGDLLQTADVFDVDAKSSYSVRVRSTDDAGASTEKAFTVQVLEVEDRPLARDDSSATDEETAVSIPVLANDTEDGDSSPDGALLTIVEVGKPGNGTATVVGREIRYQPTPNFNGEDSFVYQVKGRAAGISVANVFVRIRPVDDPPSNISLSGTSVVENQPSGTAVGSFSSTDPDGDTDFIYSLVEGDGSSDNDLFRTSSDQLVTRRSFDFETKQSYSVRVRSEDLTGQAREQVFPITVVNANDAPSAVILSNNRIDENRPAGSRLGALTAVDPDQGDSHTFALVPGSGSADNRFFSISGTILSTAEPLDYEFKTRYSVRVRATDSQGLTHDQELTVQVGDIPTPPDVPSNTLGNCNTDTITLVDGDARVTINQVVPSDKTVNGCRLTGLMTVLTNDETITNIAFKGSVNVKNQVLSGDPDAGDTIGDFQIPLAGLVFRAEQIAIEYYQETPRLRIYSPSIGIPDEWGGLSEPIEELTVIDDGGVKFGAQIQLPTIIIGKDSYELNLWAELIPVTGGYEFETIGSLTIPNVASNKQEFGKKRKTQECEIGAEVRIFAGEEGQTVLALNAAAELPASPLEVGAPDVLKLRRLKLGFSCDEGIPIGATRFALKSMVGTLELNADEQSIQVDAEIVSIEDVGGAPLMRTVGTTKLTIQPSFSIDLNVVLYVLSYQMAEAEARLTDSSFSTTLRIRAGITRGEFSINAWTTDGTFYFTGSGSARIQLKPGEYFSKCSPSFPCPTRTCWKWGIPYPCRWRTCRGLCVRIPPNSWTSPSVNADFGAFTNDAYGLKGYFSFAGTTIGFYVDHRGKLVLGNVNQYTLVSAPSVMANRQILREAQRSNMTLNPAAFDARFSYPDDSTVVINTRVAPDTAAPLTRRDDGELLASSTVISQVNLIEQTDIVFTLTASDPISMSLLAPNGDEIRPDNYAANTTYDVAYEQIREYELERDVAADESKQARLRFTSASSNAGLEEVDVQLDGVTIYSGVRFDGSGQVAYVSIAPGEHTITLIPSGGGNSILSRSFTAETGKTYGAVSMGKTTPALVVLGDDNRAPAALETARVRLINGAAGLAAGLQIDGSPMVTGTAYQAASDYIVVSAGDHTLRVLDGSGTAASEATTATFAAGYVYSILAAELTTGSFDVAWMQRMDEAYQAQLKTRYDVDQAPLGDWKVKLEGDLETIDYLLSVDGPSNPPILDNITADTANPTMPQVSWQLTSDNAPTKVSVYLFPGPITETMVVTDSNGIGSTQPVPIYEGFRVAEYEISDVNQLGGQTTTKTLDLSDVESGDYYLWIRAEDGVNPPVEGYAAAPGVRAAGGPGPGGEERLRATAPAGRRRALQRRQQQQLPPPLDARIRSSLSVTVADGSPDSTPTALVELLVEFDELDHPDVDRYLLHIGTSALEIARTINVGLGVDVLDENGNRTGERVVQVEIRSLKPGLTYFFSAEARDDDGDRSVRSLPASFTLTAGDFRLTTPAASYNVSAGSAVIVPVSVDVLEPLFYPNVDFSVDTTALPRGIVARIGASGRLARGRSTLGAAASDNVVIEVDPGVAEGTYPVVIQGASGSLRRSKTVDLVVGAQQQLLYLPQLGR